MSGATTPDLGPLTTALLLVEPGVADTLDVLRERLADLDTSSFGAAAETAAQIVARALELVDLLLAGDREDAQVVHDELGRTVGYLARIATGEEQSRTAVADADSGAADVTETVAEDAALLVEFVESAIESLDAADSLLLSLEKGDDPSAVDGVFRAFHTIKGMAGFLALHEVTEAAHDAEGLLEDARAGVAELGSEGIDALFTAVSALRTLVEGAAAGDAQGVAVPVGRSAPAAVPTTPRGRHGVRVIPDAHPSTMRVDEERLDLLLDAIGELVIAEASATQLAAEATAGPEILAAHMGRLGKISRQLQEMAISMRMVPLRTTLHRMARLVRELARDSGKKIDCTLVGEEIELDKSVVDGIGDPLLHLVRNAVDHGVEAPERRRAAGKPPAGQITISAQHLGGSMVITVADDGTGLDREAIVAKARERGVIGAAETPSPEAVPALVLAPGFSTAGVVTEVSGRGVGMDVVKKAVDGLRGTVGITSEPGRGTTVKLTLPLTLAIIDGMVIKVRGERYIVPTLSIVRMISIEPSQIDLVLGRAESLDTSGGIVPLVRLSRLFGGEDGRAEEGYDRLVLLVSDGTGTTGLVVSEVLGQQQIVIKPLGAGLGAVPGISGAAILPDGCVGLILDVPAIVRLAHNSKAEG